MDIKWYGAASLVMREGDDAIAFDPFFGLPVGCFKNKDPDVLPEEDFRGVTDVFVTHGHVDHIYHLPKLCGDLNFVVHCTPTPRKTLTKQGVPPNRIVPAATGTMDRISNFTVTAYGGRHCRYDFPIVLKTVFRKGFFRHPVHLARFVREMLRFPEKGEILMYEVSCGGKRIQVLGSLGLDESRDYPTDADILILPFQGRSDLDTYALDIVRRLRPRAVLLDHYDNAFPPVSDDIPTENFIKILSEQEHVPCRIMTKGSDIHVETGEKAEAEKALG